MGLAELMYLVGETILLDRKRYWEYMSKYSSDNPELSEMLPHDKEIIKQLIAMKNFEGNQKEKIGGAEVDIVAGLDIWKCPARRILNENCKAFKQRLKKDLELKGQFLLPAIENIMNPERYVPNPNHTWYTLNDDMIRTEIFDWHGVPYFRNCVS